MGEGGGGAGDKFNSRFIELIDSTISSCLIIPLQGDGCVYLFYIFCFKRVSDSFSQLFLISLSRCALPFRWHFLSAILFHSMLRSSVPFLAIISREYMENIIIIIELVPLLNFSYAFFFLFLVISEYLAA